MAEPFVWLNGALCPAAHTSISPADRGFTLGDGLFETLRVADGLPRHLPLHLARLRNGAATLGIPMPLDDAQFQTAIHAVLTANVLREAALRITLTRGTGPRGLLPPTQTTPTLLITAASYLAPAPEITAIISETTRRNEFSPLSRLKSLNYLDSIFALREANARGAGEAILLNTAGHATEASAANLFVLQNGNWLTPPVEDGALPGIFRARLLSRNIAREARLPPGALFTATCLCLGNTLSLRLVTRLNGTALQIDKAALEPLRAVWESQRA